LIIVTFSLKLIASPPSFIHEVSEFIKAGFSAGFELADIRYSYNTIIIDILTKFDKVT
jgi:hypothetical protein